MGQTCCGTTRSVCSDDTPTPDTDRPPFMDWEEEVLSAENPGLWEGKAGRHVPKITDEGGGEVRVEVSHGMDPEHWIECIWIKDDSSRKILDFKTFTGNDPKPRATFHVPRGTVVVAFAKCNLHSTWQSNPMRVASEILVMR
mmetsp:Transcript_6478/g.18112  ORF Transcript_6478/g.18112 Transcript_6478/m.18112 type:complete len:142 (-) Transcript_6478:242-667(-)